jgi:hypothetical protein
MADDPRTTFPNIRAYREHQLANPPGDDPLSELLPLVEGDPDRWLRVGRQLEARTPDMGRDQAIASIRADLEAGRL